MPLKHSCYKKFELAIGIIHRQVHEKNGKLVTSGMEKAGQIAHNIATTSSSQALHQFSFSSE